MRTIRGLAVLAGLIGLVSLAEARGPQSLPRTPDAPRASAALAQKTEPAKGQLRSVDATKKTLSIQAGGSDQTFMYTDETKVTGAQGGVAGLATLSGREVTVQFTMKGADRVATSIDVAPK
jgi:hypothetical protein